MAESSRLLGECVLSDYRKPIEGSVFEQKGQFLTAAFGNTLVMLTGHFAARSMNGRFDDIEHLSTSSASPAPGQGDTVADRPS